MRNSERILFLRRKVIESVGAVDRFMAQRLVDADLGGATIPCRLGCSACCYILATVTLAEAIHLVAALKIGGHKFDHDAIRRQFEIVIDPAMDLPKWQDAQEPCVALVGDRCAAYDARPLTCRAHYVVGPPEDCSPPAKGVLGIDSRGFLDIGMPPIMVASQRVGVPLSYGPLPFLVPIAITALDEGIDVAAKKLEAMGMADDESMMRWMNFAA